MKVKRRSLQRAGLSRGDRSYLRWGPPISERECSFASRADDGIVEYDEAAAFDAWLLHRGELLAEAAERGLIPWAARRFEGMPGRVSPYEHLGAPP